MKFEIIKGSETDFDTAPEWSTVKTKSCSYEFFLEHCGIGAKYINAKYPEMVKIASTTAPDSDEVIIAERRPITEPVWDVSTPPPVGIECEVLFTSEGSVFERARILHAGDDGIVGRWLTGDSAGGLFDYMYIPHDYRPIRSPEDVARDEAKAAIAELCRSSASNGHSADLIYEAIITGNVIGITKTPTVSELMRVTEKATREDCEAIVKLLSGK